MRPVRLELKGFTAYREAEVLDFDNFDLFAITGPTGSGKSSLLDAMTYALFGKTPRVGNRASLLIAQGQPRLSVMLDFDVDGGRYRIHRSAGLRAASAQVRLERLDEGRWQSYGEGADRVRDATKIVVQLIGLDYEAFIRSVLLPQGQFHEFLVGDPSRRRDILTELLGLELFERMAAKAGEGARVARTAAQAKQEVLDSQFAGVDQEAVRAAKREAKDAKATAAAMTKIERSLEKLAGRWVEEVRRIEAMDELVTDAGELSDQAGRIAGDLKRLSKELSQARREEATASEKAGAAEQQTAASAALLAEAESTLGSLEDLARLQAGLEELARLDARIRTAEDGLVSARTKVEEGEQALEAVRRATETAGNEYQVAAAAKSDAEAEYHRAHEADLVATLTKERKVGDLCPICSRPLERLPKAEYKVLAKAERERDRAAELEKRAGDAWGRAERDEVAVERDLAAARRELAAREAEAGSCQKEREALLPDLAASFGGDLPADPVREIDQRIKGIRKLQEEAAARGRAEAKAREEVSRAKERLAAFSASGKEQVAALRALPIPRLLGRARAPVPDLEASAELTAAVPDDPVEALVVASSRAQSLAGVVSFLGKAASEARAGLDVLLEEARASLPDGLPADQVTDLDGLIEAVRMAGRDLVAQAATAARDAERLTDQLTARKTLEKEVEALGSRARVYQSLAGELRRDRLITYLQEEALELLAEAGSERLLFLSQDRYRLVFEEDEFFVEDRQNGDERRSVRTLSGGETFLASLALALALAEQIPVVAVSQRSRLQSLFIDEGFGALDPDSLEVATEALSRLGGQDRMVGVVTHVSELAEKMPVRVVVEKFPNGSRLQVLS
jgi:DNA repair protein SbcC/Rad50